MKYMMLLLIIIINIYAFSNAHADTFFEFKVSGDDCGSSEINSPSFVSEFKNQYLSTIVQTAMNCAYVAHKPSYKVSKDTIVFNFETYSPSGAMTRCVCNTTIEFKLYLEFKRHAVKFVDKKILKIVVIMDGKEIHP